MANRITGLASGLDIDSLVTDTMKAYRIKIQTQEQKRDIIEIKQQLYRDVINDSRELYEKYFSGTGTSNLLLQKNWSTTKFETTNSSVVSINGGGGAKAENYSVTVKQLASKAHTTMSTTEFGTGGVDADGKANPTGRYVQLTINVEEEKDGKKENVAKTLTIDTWAAKTDDKGNATGEFEIKSNTDIIDELNSKITEAGGKYTASYSEFSKGIVLESQGTGEDAKNGFALVVTDTDGNPISGVEKDKDGKDVPIYHNGTNAEVEIRKGTEVYTHTGGSNSLTLDGIEFKFTDISKITGTDASGNNIYEESRIVGKNDTTDMVDTISKFVEDYNKLIEKMNTLTSEKLNRSYQPLTADQKKEMSETEIKLWEEKVKQGQLHRDSDLTRITNKMKGAMSTTLGSSLNLKKIGITPVEDYGTKNGTFEVDKDKLAKALEENSSDIMNMFIGKASKDGKTQDGIFQKLKTTLYDETVTVKSSLIKKAGIANSSTSSNNTLSKSIETYNKKILQMEKIFSTKEQALYSKYASLETAMNNYNSQMNYLSSQTSS